MNALKWENNTLLLLDQTRLPREETWVTCTTADDVAEAIVSMKVRGAPAIGASAAYGVALEAMNTDDTDVASFRAHMEATLQRLAQTRPTAVNLFWGIERMRQVLRAEEKSAPAIVEKLVAEAHRIAEEDVRTNRAIGKYGAELFDGEVEILTHCNTGSLATVEFGTALGVIRTLHEQGKLKHVWVDETRPFLQGARLTAYELAKDGIVHTLVTDNMAAHFMKEGRVGGVIVGADRIAKNGDTANKIGTYGLAVLCQYHRIPFYVAAPTSTFDLQISSGAEIPIEQRSVSEVVQIGGQRIAPEGTNAAHPAFDVTPHELITGIITERGVILNPSADSVVSLVG